VGGQRADLRLGGGAGVRFQRLPVAGGLHLESVGGGLFQKAAKAAQTLTSGRGAGPERTKQNPAARLLKPRTGS